ncbi:septum formation initiator family protein [Aureisphaera galaxeae]|uniref:FtsB family cell division protein n=1 Tax=Aureisphaera galaxeae TaxID=1538023 RepID=UPI002350B85F|nr:septum formation initiator family protein [Aureisphaera galaxeae]MDC8003502.1 septum formation initiator family protein [Aureisphaera galaxeae]
MKFSKISKNKWFKVLSGTYIIVAILFLVWNFYFDANSYFLHKELREEINSLEETKEFYEEEIKKDRAFIEKMKDSNEVEKYAREKYYLKRENEDIYIIEHEDSLKLKSKNE